MDVTRENPLPNHQVPWGLHEEYEITLEQRGRLDEFRRLAEAQFQRSWAELLHDDNVDQHFSLLIHHLFGNIYSTPQSWLEISSRAGRPAASSIEEITKDIARMLEQRAKGRTLLLLVADIGRYLDRNGGPMLHLQTLVEDLGYRLKRQAWLIAVEAKRPGGLRGSDRWTSSPYVHSMMGRFPRQLLVDLTQAPVNA